MAHEFCRTLYKQVMVDVRKKVSKAVIGNSWGYKYSGDDTVEFHINKCEEVPEGYYWYDRGCCVWCAKAEGWLEYLEKVKLPKEEN